MKAKAKTLLKIFDDIMSKEGHRDEEGQGGNDLHGPGTGGAPIVASWQAHILLSLGGSY